MKSDFFVEEHGAVAFLVPRTQAAQAWIESHLTGKVPSFGTERILPTDMAEGVAFLMVKAGLRGRRSRAGVDYAIN